MCNHPSIGYYCSLASGVICESTSNGHHHTCKYAHIIDHVPKEDQTMKDHLLCHYVVETQHSLRNKERSKHLSGKYNTVSQARDYVD